jgi:23S rRNA pseudouridine2605 synthase
VRERLQKILSGAGIASRRAAERLIEEGRVEVDGRVVRELGTSADPEIQEIRVDGTRIRPGRPRRYIALNKPKGFVTTRADPGRRPTVMELLPPALRNLYPVGRLDMGSTGLLILTDDGELAQKLTHPRFGVEKSYLVTVAGQPDKKTLERATRGITVDGERLSLEEVEVLGGRADRRLTTAEPMSGRTRLRVTLRRGKNREIRRLFEALGFPVVDLHRERIGGLSVKGIPPGGFRPLSRAEAELLLRRPERPQRRGLSRAEVKHRARPPSRSFGEPRRSPKGGGGRARPPRAESARAEPSARAQGERSESRSKKRWGWGPSATNKEPRAH